MRLRYGFALCFLAASSMLFARAHTAPSAQTAVALHPDLLPTSFGNWHTSSQGAGSATEPSFSLNNASQAVLEEDGPERSAVQTYADAGGKLLKVEAVEFKDVSGALAAYSAVVQPGMKPIKDLGTTAATGDGGALFVSGAALVAAFPATLAEHPATLLDVDAMRALAELMPKPVGAQGQQPLLPHLLPERGLVAGSMRYALGQQGYMAEGGVLPAGGLGWSKDAEAVTAKFADRRGAETLTLLLYPTPAVAGPEMRSIEAELPGLGPSFAHAKVRREGSLVVVASGSFSADAAQALTENTHLHQFASTDKATPTPEVVETRKTFGLLANVIVFAGVLGLAAVLLGLFLGGGRALIRVLGGKPAATEAEFLSLHLDPQNPTPMWTGGKTGE